jgi:hypothetical protein
MADANPSPRKVPTVFGIPPKVFAVVAILAGTMSCVQGAIRGRSAGYEAMMIYAGPAIVGAVLAIALERSRITYVAAGFGLLGLIGLMLGW